jgi:uncharacterized protein (DUF488 family)
MLRCFHISVRRGYLDLSKTVLWTIGHSNRSVEKFLKLLEEHNVRILVDIRSFLTSKIEHFKREET